MNGQFSLEGKGKKIHGLNRVLYAMSITWRLDALMILLSTNTMREIPLVRPVHGFDIRSPTASQCYLVRQSLYSMNVVYAGVVRPGHCLVSDQGICILHIYS